MNLFYKYSHLQRFEQQNEKDGRKEKGQMRKEKWEMTKEKGEMEMGEGKRKDFPPEIPQQKVSLLLFRF